MKRDTKDLYPGVLVRLLHDALWMYDDVNTAGRSAQVDATEVCARAALVISAIPQKSPGERLEYVWCMLLTENRTGWVFMWPDMYEVIAWPE